MKYGGAENQDALELRVGSGKIGACVFFIVKIDRIC